MKSVKFSWDGHVGSQTPKEFYELSPGQTALEMAKEYVEAVRSGEIFGEPIPLDENAVRDMAKYLEEFDQVDEVIAYKLRIGCENGESYTFEIAAKSRDEAISRVPAEIDKWIESGQWGTGPTSLELWWELYAPGDVCSFAIKPFTVHTDENGETTWEIGSNSEPPTRK